MKCVMPSFSCFEGKEGQQSWREDFVSPLKLLAFVLRIKIPKYPR